MVAGVAWQSAGWGFARFVANSSQYEAIYSGFAIIILFMIWLYVSWIVVLTGASIGFYIQHPEYLTVTPGEEPRRRTARCWLICCVCHRHVGAPVVPRSRPANCSSGSGWARLPISRPAPCPMVR